MKRLDAREKVKLLAATYLDAATSGSQEGTGSGRSPFQSRPHYRNEELWHQGSYAALEHGMNTLRIATTRRLPFSWFWRVYVLQTDKLDGLAAHKKHSAEQGLTFVTAHVVMSTGRNIYVPGEVVENAGWTKQDAKAAARPRKLAA